jgi:hypothetical protein
MGEERHPVIVIDDFAPDPDAMRAAAAQLEFVSFHDQYYPGTRAIAPPEYYRTVCETVTDSLREFFGCRAVRLQQAYYSLATTPRRCLSQAQRLPHYDTVYENYYAAVHFLCPAVFGGIAFFRQCRTGFETVNAARQPRYSEFLDAGLAQHGDPQPRYIAGDSPLFDQIGLIEARWNRAVIFRGNCLHSGAISNAIELSNDPLNGRLTVVSFLIAD